MATEISNNGASLKIVVDLAPRYILKNQIKEVEVVRDTIIKIDIGQGALYNVYVDQADVDSPASTSVDDLREQIMGMLQTVSNAGGATELKQDNEIAAIGTLQAQVKDLQTKIGSVDSKLFFKPSMIDENNPNFVYRGYSMPGSKTSDAVWAVEKVSVKKGVLTSQWAAGNKNFDKVWDNRATLAFS
jgi:hypothetical protein